ncbi:Hypothetical Protein RradSPS_3137 (plasmid) [Rubrobacter radiotolerans]|uniref:Uncharacterized protein n=1 Tax=Rubrobacter radiotolerans TaxID=42256 RepID=A0A023X8R0_RUBRA|nr:Hypothetical Protein RradSPS_3137 [Rubrobacter radiotolerans]
MVLDTALLYILPAQGLADTCRIRHARAYDVLLFNAAHSRWNSFHLRLNVAAMPTIPAG